MKTAPIPCLLTVVIAILAATSTAWAKSECAGNEGRLEAFGPEGKSLGQCPLKHTDVSVDIAGFVARVTVRQQFHNPFAEKIEAVYVFPLSHEGAVDQMTMKVGRRVIRGEIKERGEARAIYDRAKARGHVASLLDQERPNIFTQSVANIEPGAEVEITIGYSETLPWVDGEYRFSFPMTVEPRYMPGVPLGQPPATAWAPPTNQVPDADKISPPVTPEGTRAGHDISLTVNLNAGLPIRRLESRQHAVDVLYPAADKSRAVVTLRDQKTIPNKDFVLHYQTAGEEIADTLLTHTDERGKFFTLILQPPQRVRKEAIVPKELIFAIDKSGSMRGFPIETAKKAMRLCIEGAHQRDTFNLICFDGGTSFCFEHPVPNTPENRRAALDYLDRLSGGGGGTEMMTAIDACLRAHDDPERVRIVCFMTDGCVGNDREIIGAVRQNAHTARVFAFGIGHSVNRYLLDGIAQAGRGEVRYILDFQDAAAAAEKFYERVRTPVLTDVRLTFGGLRVEEVYPKQIPDLFSATPVVIKGRYAAPGKATITLRGRTGEGNFERKIAVRLPAEEPKNEVLASLWARAKVDDLASRLLATVSDVPDAARKDEIVKLGLRYRLLTEYTSFVAVEEEVATSGGPAKTVAVPVEMPEDVSYLGVFGAAGHEKLGLSAKMSARYDGSYGFELRAGGTSPGLGRGGSGTGAFIGRGQGHREAAVGAYGGTKASERGVASAINWLARHQGSGGSWRFNPPAGAKDAYADRGTWNSESAATGLALLPFLGAGQTHQSKGPYQRIVLIGIRWLEEHQKPDGDLAAGGSSPMLSHALAAIALCEAFGMTRDRNVGEAAQRAIAFIAAAQDEKTGGWAEPGERPSLSVSAWPIMALTSGKMAGLTVPKETYPKAAKFVDSLQNADGVRFGDTTSAKPDDAAAALGHLARWYLGSRGASVLGAKNLPLVDVTPPATPAPTRPKPAIEFWSRRGPLAADAVANFWATTFMRTNPGPEWDSWNRKMRRQLIDAQVKGGDEDGSWWNPKDVRAAAGGRLLQTALSAMTLEVYYRYWPLYKTPEK